MAQSPTHKFGQIIGRLVEAAVEPRLQEFAAEHDLYLDQQGERKARPGKKLTWEDKFGNEHDLDYVMERGGSDEEIGDPVAFIEVAWRRYTKHSRNKAQEIQGAVRPLAETFEHMSPFLGAIVSGVFTRGSIDQMESLGFSVLYFKYDTIVEAFSASGVDAHWEEGTPNEKVQEEVEKWEKLSQDDKENIRRKLIRLNEEEIQEFIDDLRETVERQVTSIRVLPLHGSDVVCDSVEEAIGYVETYDEETVHGTVDRFELQIRYSNDDRIDAKFSDKGRAIEFLELHAGGAVPG